MKKLALALIVVLAFSGAALAVNYSNATITLEGTNVWTNGKLTNSTAVDNTTLRLSQTDSKNNWKGNAEFTINAGKGKNDNQSNGTFTLNDVYFQLTKQPFTFEIWNWGENGQGVDFKTPLEWVFANDAPKANWASRVNADIAGQNIVLQVKNDKSKPEYYLFTKRVIGDTTAGAAYKTTFNHNSVLAGWATHDLGPVTVTGEVAYGSYPDPDDNKLNFGAKANFESGLNLYGYANNIADKKFVEANYSNRYYGSYTILNKGDKTTIDVKYQQNGTQGIGVIDDVKDGFFQITVLGDNDWLKNRGFVAGAILTNEDNVVVSNGDSHNRKNNTFFAGYGLDNMNALVTLNNVAIEDVADPKEFGSSSVKVRGYYKVTSKLALHPRYFTNTYEDPAKKDTSKIGSYVSYALTKGQLMGGLWLASTEGEDDADQIIEAGYKVSF